MFLAILIGLTCVIALTPYQSVVVPEWKIELVKEDGTPVPNTAVRQEWSSSGRSPILSEVRTSDENGVVTFPKRQYFAPLFWRALVRFGDIANNFIMLHGGRIGNYSRVKPVKDNYYDLEYRGEATLEHKLIVRGFYE